MAAAALDPRAEVDPEAEGARRHPFSGRARLSGLAVVTAGWAVVVITLIRARMALYSEDLAVSWQLVELPVLARDPLGSVWYLHTQPPLYNLVVGSVLRWSPFAPMGTLFVLYLLSLWALMALLADVLAGWRVPPSAAGVIAVLGTCSPTLLVTIGWAGYDVPVAALLVASIWWFQRYLRMPGLPSLVGLAASLTALGLTRSLFHPVFVLVVVALAGVARRAPWRHLAVALALPVLLLGGWMLKNQVLFGTATTSSWLGSNLQRGVTAPMARADVERDVADGAVSPLALVSPWGALSAYPEAVGSCRPAHRHAAVDHAFKYESGSFKVANYGNECFLPVYEQQRADAMALVRRHPGRYLRTRLTVLESSFAVTNLDRQTPTFANPTKSALRRTWIDRGADVVLVPVTVRFDLGGWNLPLLGDLPVVLRISPVLALLAAAVAARGVVAVVRLARSGWQDRPTWGVDELMWVLVAGSVLFVVGVGDLVEFGENGRFRAIVDPLLVAMPLAAVVRRVRAAHTPSSGPGGGSTPSASSRSAQARSSSRR